MKQQQLSNVYSSAITVKKAAELVRHVVKNVSGSEVATTINNSPVTAQTIESLAIARFQKNLGVATK